MEPMTQLALTFELAGEPDIPELTAAMTRAFDDDARLHLGQERGGPPGYDDGEFFREWMLGYEESTGYKILADSQVIGGMILWIIPDGHNFLGTIFVDPAYQDQGVATRAWAFIQATYPEAKSWTLQTPAYATKNHHVYGEKWGFAKVGEEAFEGPGGKVFVYKKVMERRGIRQDSQDLQDSTC
jgi:GNAT superfamily N-acetyltransferase